MSGLTWNTFFALMQSHTNSLVLKRFVVEAYDLYYAPLLYMALVAKDVNKVHTSVQPEGVSTQAATALCNILGILSCAVTQPCACDAMHLERKALLPHVEGIDDHLVKLSTVERG